MSVSFEDALNYAVDAHTNFSKTPEKAFRKYTGEPYWHHSLAVANELMNARITDPEMLAAALLHDVVEDTTITLESIRKLFGDNVAKLVDELTDKYEYGYKIDDKLVNRAQRKELERKRTAKISRQAMSIKLADLIDNTRSIVKHDPHFANKYLKEKREILKALYHASSVQLLAKAWRFLIEAETKTGEFAK